MHYEPSNPMIKAALDAGKDATGLCTVRECAQFMLDAPKNPADHMELAFTLDDGRRVNVAVQILKVE